MFLSFAVLVQALRPSGSSSSSRVGLAREPSSILARRLHSPHLHSTLGHKVGPVCWTLCSVSGNLSGTSATTTLEVRNFTQRPPFAHLAFFVSCCLTLKHYLVQ